MVDPLRHPPAFETETKWLFPALAAGPLRAFLNGVCRREQPHSENVVHTIYFDSPGLASYAEKRSSDHRKTKVRWRWYGDEGFVFAEIKRRVGHQRLKKRLLLPFPAREVADLSLDDRRFADLFRDFARAIALQGEAMPAQLAPVVRLGYRRLRLIEPSSGLRVALDTEIRAEDLASRLGGRAAAAPWRGAVVEFKGHTDTIPAPLTPLRSLGGRRVALSKYAVVLEARPGGN